MTALLVAAEGGPSHFGVKLVVGLVVVLSVLALLSGGKR